VNTGDHPKQTTPVDKLMPSGQRTRALTPAAQAMARFSTITLFPHTFLRSHALGLLWSISKLLLFGV
jgi:hypothetical protein